MLLEVLSQALHAAEARYRVAAAVRGHVTHVRAHETVALELGEEIVHDKYSGK